MGYIEIKERMFAVGRVVSQSLMRSIRANFESHEQRITDIETNKSTVPTASIFEYAGETAPQGFLLCDGSEVSRTTFASLFAIVGTSYGTPSNNSVFKLPDARGRVFVGSEDSYSVGDTGGEEEHQLTASENPTHKHDVTDPGHTHGGVYYILSVGGLSFRHLSSFSSTQYDPLDPYHLNTESSTTGVTVQNAGSGSGHNNVQPSLATNYIIKT